MPVPVAETPVHSMEESPPRKRWSRSECAVLERVGLLQWEPVELIGGYLFRRQRTEVHTYVASKVTRWFYRQLGGELVSAGSSIDVAPEDNPTNEPRPDLILLNRNARGSQVAHPAPPDLDLVVQVSDRSLYLDLSFRAALYARAAIGDYWVVDIAHRRLIAHRDPAEGRYQSILAYSEDESIAPLAVPGSPFSLAKVLKTP